MGRPYQFLYPLFSLFLVRVDLTDINALSLRVRILKVYDGDTVLVSQGSYRTKVRLSRIDAPEKGQPFSNGRGDAGEVSKKCLMRFLGGTGTLEIHGTDMYGRILGDVDKVSLKLIKAGCSSLYPHAKFESQQEKYFYLRAYYEARNKKLGLWGQGGFEQPKIWRKKHKKKFRKQISDRQWHRSNH